MALRNFLAVFCVPTYRQLGRKLDTQFVAVLVLCTNYEQNKGRRN